VFYRDGLKVDITVSEEARVRAMRTGLSALYARGYRVVLDRDGVADGLPAPTGRPTARVLPDQAELDAVVAEFWFEAAHIPRLLLRDELWLVKHRDWTMKQLLRRALEWEALARGDAVGAPADVWHVGAHMREWAEPSAWRDLHDAFGGFGAGESWAALLATASLFRRTARAVAGATGLAYAEEIDAAVSAYLRPFADRLPPG
jgi:aminoglycoside 6-adenylyltransferase